VGNALRRQAASMLVSRVEDRFGNSLAYRYDGQGNLTVIEASDGRQLALTYEAWQYPLPAMTGFRLTSATLQPASDAPRTWKYGYASDPANPRLNSVQLPDGSEWAFPDA